MTTTLNEFKHGMSAKRMGEEFVVTKRLHYLKDGQAVVSVRHQRTGLMSRITEENVHEFELLGYPPVAIQMRDGATIHIEGGVGEVKRQTLQNLHFAKKFFGLLGLPEEYGMPEHAKEDYKELVEEFGEPEDFTAAMDPKMKEAYKHMGEMLRLFDEAKEKKDAGKGH